MSAPKGNVNARKGHHQRVQVPFSGTQLDAIYASLGLYEHENEPEQVREAVQKLVHDALWNLDTARCFNGPKCHTGAPERHTSDMVWCEIGKHYGWYCGICYDVEHSPKDEARATLAMYKEQQKETMSEVGESPERGKAMIDFQNLIDAAGIRRDAVNTIFYQDGRDVTPEDLDALREQFLTTHPDWTLDDVERVDIASLASIGEGE